MFIRFKPVFFSSGKLLTVDCIYIVFIDDYKWLFILSYAIDWVNPHNKYEIFFFQLYKKNEEELHRLFCYPKETLLYFP